MGIVKCQNKGENWRGVVSLQTQKFELYPSTGYNPYKKNRVPSSVPWSQITYWKYASNMPSMAFRHILLNILLALYIFSYTILKFLKKLIGTKFLNTKGVKQDYLPELYCMYTMYPMHLKNPTQQPKIYLYIKPENSPFHL